MTSHDLFRLDRRRRDGLTDGSIWRGSCLSAPREWQLRPGNLGSDAQGAFLFRQGCGVSPGWRNKVSGGFAPRHEVPE